MKIISWNVNGIRARIKGGFADFVAEHQPDVICLQETKALPEQVELELPGYTLHWHWATTRKGYSGVAIFTKCPVLDVVRGTGTKKHDNEGRVIAVELNDLYVVSVYVPNSKRDLTRLDDRLNWDAAFRRRLTQLADKKPVVFCGDLNVAHTEIDLARPKQNKKTHGFTPQERDSFSKLLRAGFTDTFRHHHPDQPGHYTWWRQFGGAKERNVGWRIDYVCTSSSAIDRVTKAFILRDVEGSDHCPVGIEWR